MGSPLLTVGGILVDLELVGDTLDLELPLLLTNAGLDDSVLLHIGLHLLGEVVVNIAASKVKIFIDVVVGVNGGVHFVREVSTALHVFSINVVGVIESGTVLLDDWLSEAVSELVLDGDGRQLQEHLANSVTVAGL